MNHPHASDPLPRHAPLALWRAAEAFLRVLHNLFGAPEDVAARHTLTGAAYRLLLSWLGIGEAMMRRLLLIEASAFAKPNTRPLLHPRRRRARKLVGFDADAPEKWRVSFRCFTTARRLPAGGKTRRPPQGKLSREDRWSGEFQQRVSFHSAWPAAERYEALLRVFNDPVPTRAASPSACTRCRIAWSNSCAHRPTPRTASMRSKRSTKPPRAHDGAFPTPADAR